MEAYHAGTNNAAPKSFMGGGIVQETVIFTGIIIGERPRVECKVSATKTRFDRERFCCGADAVQLVLQLAQLFFELFVQVGQASLQRRTGDRITAEIHSR